uniref:Metallo-beta-lactamase domain containing 2 n=1 Tax=Callorhinchus milii TaxID=7868 RepID=A0A4W3K7L1_CALMI
MSRGAAGSGRLVSEAPAAEWLESEAPAAEWLESQSGNRANMWLLRGSHLDLLIDAGLGLRSVPDYLKRAGLIGSRPLLAVATHVHFDHSGGLHQFEKVAVHRAEAEALVQGDNFETVTWLSDSEIVKAPEPGWTARNYSVRPVLPARVLEDGDVINLGDRQLTVLHMPGHSRGSICLHDRDQRILFSGDVVYNGSMIDWLPYSNISDYTQTCERLIELADNELVHKVFPGHFNSFGPERLHSLASSYISNVGLCHKVSTSAVRCIANLALRANNFSCT